MVLIQGLPVHLAAVPHKVERRGDYTGVLVVVVVVVVVLPVSWF